MSDHGAGCVCWRCEGAREKEMESELSGLAYENNGTGHGAGCVCWQCSGMRKKRVNDIVRRYMP